MPRPYDLSSMTALISFEAAARHRSFKRAAAEINVTPAAVSHQIKALEADLGCTLFTRQHRGVDLTEKGAFLLVALQRGFETISASVAQLRNVPQSVDVTIRATTAVSALWLTPKLTAFWKSHPTISVAQIVNDVSPPGGAPVGRDDLSIGYLEPGATDGWHILFRDRILALGTPGFAQKHGIRSARDLIHAPLVHLSGDDNPWTGWPDWFATLGLAAPATRGFLVNNHMIALQAAEDDVGAVLAWEGLMQGALKQGRLTPLVPESIPSKTPFCLKVPPGLRGKARLFADWLIANAAGDDALAPHIR
ncbi:LysR family transcriptional regulator [Gemmobacter serpentinus]|uniref:LysR family transcriptional regulator n=1 Tax=Gemmobacter serpentinus TaxID=2652247 RepID=UPI00124C979A|nr:LysR family transcriptional regulator [Gemmobacter serpentinus]